MNIQEQESGLTSLLLESIQILHNNNIYNKDLRIYENNFKSLMNVINESEIQETSEIKSFNPHISINQPNNVYAYITKVISLCESYDKSLIHNLNESFDSSYSNHSKDKHDISSYIKYMNRIKSYLKKQNDFDKFNNQIVSLKVSLHQPLSVYGMNVCSLSNTNNDVDGIIFDKSNKIIIFVKEGVSPWCYDISTDDYHTLADTYSEYINNNEESEIINKLKPNNFITIIKEYIHSNMIPLYVNIDKLGLKYSDNLYKDQAQKSAVQDKLKQQELMNSRFVFDGIMRNNKFI